MYCFAQIYINALPWATISSKETTQRRGDAYVSDTFLIRPETALFTIYNYRLGTELEELIDTTKCCTFYVHVEIHEPEWVYHLQNQRKANLHYLEQWQELIYGIDYHFANSYKLTYWIEYSEKVQSCKVTQKALIGCQDFTAYANHTKRSCEMHLKSHPEFQKCISIAHYEYFMSTDVVIFNKNPNAQLIKTVMQTSCSQPLISFQSEIPLSSYPSNFYLRQYNPSKTNLEPIFFGKVLFPNSTLISRIWEPFGDTNEFSWLLALNSIIPNSIFVVSTPFDALQFVTCVPLQQRKCLSLLGYISAFDLATWLIILFNCILSVIARNYILGIWSLRGTKLKKNMLSALATFGQPYENTI